MTGQDATAIVNVNGSGAVAGVTIVDGGSAYGIGFSMHVVGVSTRAGWCVGVVSVTSIYDNAGDIIKIVGITSATTQDYNQLYRIVGVYTG